MTSREMETNPEVLYFRMSDDINQFVREALIENNLVDSEIYDARCDELLLLKKKIARSVAESWKVATFTEDDVSASGG